MLAEQRPRAADRAERAVEAGGVVAVGEAQPEALGADAPLDQLSEVAHAEHHLAGAVSGEQPQLVVEERLAGDLEQRLGRVAHTPTQARAQPPGEDAHRGQGTPLRACGAYIWVIFFHIVIRGSST